jgi:DNA repair exonuclease SbcCD ATPase subunit
LTAQVNRLLEQNNQEKISLQQTQTTADAEMTRLRRSHEAEVTALREELRRNREDREECAASFRTSEQELGLELSRLRTELTDKEERIAIRERDLQSARAELASVYEKLAFSESRWQQEKEGVLRDAQQVEAAFHAELAAKDRALEEHHETAERLEQGYCRQLDDLHNQLADLRSLLDRRSSELDGRPQSMNWSVAGKRPRSESRP